MQQAVERPNTNTAPTTPETFTPTEKEGVYIEQCPTNDEELSALAKKNSFNIRQGSINMEMLESLTPSYGWAYKILQESNNSAPREAVGGVYVSRKGMDYGFVEIAYFVDQDHQQLGLARAAVGAVTEELTNKYGVVANIDPHNDPSVKLAQQLGYIGLGDGRDGTTAYIKSRKRPQDRARAA